jgi:hypothetical protein
MQVTEGAQVLLCADISLNINMALCSVDAAVWMQQPLPGVPAASQRKQSRLTPGSNSNN